MKPLKEKISITIDADLLERIRAESERDSRSVSQYINYVLTLYFRQKDAHDKSKSEK
ncbi:MAG: toxin-antitoxin system protein [Clostridia bacterium]|nr:toxin-antitoxin system protein [Clostridia bacterium]